MHIDWNNLSPVSPIGGITPQQRLDPGATEASQEAAAPAAADIGTLGGISLTPDALRAALLDMGIAVDSDSMELAETFARLGLPLTDTNMLEGRSVLARYPRLPVAAYAMAKILDAPISTGVLRALARVIEGALSKNPLPDDILENLGLVLDGGSDTKELARDLYQIISRLGRSTEQRILQSDVNADNFPDEILSGDPRAQLLTIAADMLDRTVRTAADAHAAHFEGQQILNQIALKRFDPPVPLYFSFPFRVADYETVPAEIQVWTRDPEQEKTRGEFNESGLVLQTTIRLSPSKLGMIEIQLTGKQDANLKCQVFVEKPNAYRLLRRSTSELATGLSNAGWVIDTVQIDMAEAFRPLWYGGAALTNPRGRVDQKV